MHNNCTALEMQWAGWAFNLKVADLSLASTVVLFP